MDKKYAWRRPDRGATLLQMARLTVPVSRAIRLTMNAQPAAVFSRVAAISAQVRGRILAAQLGPGDRLPSVRTLARSHGVSPLRPQGSTSFWSPKASSRRAAARGTMSPAMRRPSAPRTCRVPSRSSDSIWSLRRDDDSHSLMVDAGCGWLPPEWFFGEGVRAALTQVARRPAICASHYGSAHGLRALRHHLFQDDRPEQAERIAMPLRRPSISSPH